MQDVGRLLLVFAVVLALVGGIMVLLGHFGGRHMPGDIVVHRGNFTLYLPIVSSILISLVLTILLNLIFRR